MGHHLVSIIGRVTSLAGVTHAFVVMAKQTLLNAIMMVEIVAPSSYHMDRKGNMNKLTLNKKIIVVHI